MRILSLISFLLFFSVSAYGSDLTTQKSTLYPYRSSISLQNDFIGGTSTTGNLGETGYNGFSGTFTILTSETNRLGILRRETGAVPATVASLGLSASSAALDPSLPHAVLWIERLNTNDANTTIRIGSMNSITANPPTHGVYFEKLDADTNYFCITRAGGVQTRNDSGIAVNTGFNDFFYVRNSSGVEFRINGASVCGTHTTNLPTTFINPGTQIITSAAANKTHDHDYSQVEIYGIQR